ncbi:MAG TPA: ATP-binding protein, partial [Lachnospiraceae bacterium]|nr:ATP-binding protein [Lachnospiraceae bacterium]
MTEGVLWISGLSAGILRFLAGLFLIHRLLSAEKPDRKCILCGLSGVLVITAACALFPMSEFYRAGGEAVWLAACAHRFQRADIRMSLFVSVFYRMALSLWQFLLLAGLGIVFRAKVLPENDSLYGQAALWLPSLLLPAGMAYLLIKREAERKAGFRLASMIAVAGFLAAVSLSEQTILVIPDDTLTMWIILSVVLMMALMIFNINRRYEAEREVARLKAEQAELLERDYTVLNRAYGVNARLFHDFHNHVGVLRQMLVRQNYDGAVQYLDELQGPVRDMADTVWTGEETVDYLINSKAAAAAADQIAMRVQVEFPRHTGIHGADLCAILGNLLDNALEAAHKVPDVEDRFITLTIRRIHHMLVIKVENSF